MAKAQPKPRCPRIRLKMSCVTRSLISLVPTVLRQLDLTAARRSLVKFFFRRSCLSENETQSAKAKGRRLQADRPRPPRNVSTLNSDDVRSTSMEKVERISNCRLQRDADTLQYRGQKSGTSECMERHGTVSNECAQRHTPVVVFKKMAKNHMFSFLGAF